MRTTQQFSITLTNEMADMVRSRVASGLTMLQKARSFVKGFAH